MLVAGPAAKRVRWGAGAATQSGGGLCGGRRDGVPTRGALAFWLLEAVVLA